MPTYKLYYFDGRCRAETARILFKLAGVEFEDVRIAPNDWPEVKKTMPMGQLPLLDVDGVKICQSNAINRCLAREFGYAGKDNLEAARVDMVADCIEELYPKISALYAMEGEELEAAKESYRTETAMRICENLQKILESNNEGSGYFVGDKMTWVDICFVNLLEYALARCDAPRMTDKFPKLKELIYRVESNPTIAAWIKERPVTAF